MTPFNRLTQWENSAGAEQCAYDALHRLISVQGDFSTERVLTYDTNYNVTKLALGEDYEALVLNASYDAFGQPLTMEVGGKVTRYEYDANGRLIKITGRWGTSLN